MTKMNLFEHVLKIKPWIKGIEIEYINLVIM